MINPKITITCKCGKKTTIIVKSIIELNNEVERLKQQVYNLTNINKNGYVNKESEDFMQFFGDITQGNK